MPVAPKGRCTDPQCQQMATVRGRCDDHQPTPWAGRPSAEARYEMSRGRMRTLKKRVMRRDYGHCYICGGEGAQELEHKVPVSQGGSPDDLDNLGVAHVTCHAEKTQAEAQEAAQAKRVRPTH